ncbi:MAG: pilus assembly protein [Anaerolineales bacterium]|nr:pilus assembly protein [Anaerolineales bacterium]
MNLLFRFTPPRLQTKAQALVEFAIVLPFLLAILYGVIELSRLAFMFSSTSNASRAAARYGAGAGENIEGTPHYLDCDGIREIALQSAYVTDFSEVNITYDRGVNADGTQIPIPGIDPIAGTNSCPLENATLRNGDRIIVQVRADYKPIISIIPISEFEIVSSNARTFIIAIPILGSAMPTGFAAETSTPSRVPGTRTFTPTITATATRVAINLTEFSQQLTNAPTPTITLTPSQTPPPSRTPTITPTHIFCSGLTGITNGPLNYVNGAMQMEIYNNTGYPIRIGEIYIEWNHDQGHQGADPTLRLTKITLTNQNWQGEIFAPFQSIKDFQPLVPVGTSIIKFNFQQSYDHLDGAERVLINLATSGCENTLLDSKK